MHLQQFTLGVAGGYRGRDADLRFAAVDSSDSAEPTKVEPAKIEPTKIERCESGESCENGLCFAGAPSMTIRSR